MSINICDLAHIPPRLHYNDRPLLDEFHIGEEIYRRSKLEAIEHPFAAISLADISVNRQGNPQSPLSVHDDVLFNTVHSEGEDVPKYRQGVVVLEVKELLGDNTFKKEFHGQDKQGNPVILELHLKHRPIPCNYVHCVFELIFNGEVVTMANYKNTLDKYKELKNNCRLAIQQMIIRREIRINFE